MNTDNLKNEIDNFISVFRSHLKFVYEAPVPKYGELYKKIICVCVLDTLSKTVFPIEKRNRKRFIDFLEKFSKDDLWNRVSLLHLIEILKRTNDSAFENLAKYANKKMGDPHNANDEPPAKLLDPEYEETQVLWPNTVGDIEGLSLEHLTHKHLFYSYRNYLIHEMRRIGGVLDDDLHHADPFYYSAQHSGENKSSWKLVYPLGFHIRVCENALKNVEDYCLSSQTNPYDSFDRGVYFLTLLNDAE